ncbi:hypothetical protein BVX97_03210 [bacterium E08(2017)]|nr:hypothetical protein BVX97_03210 [bacterium E08(2017)]
MKCQYAASLAITIAIFCTSLASSKPHQKGEFTISFKERSPLSKGSTVTARIYGSTNSNVRIQGSRNTDYKLRNMSFEVVVPKTYNPQKPMALMVWISANDYGNCPRSMMTPLSQQGYIFVGANKSGNEQSTLTRLGLAIDAAVNMSELYNIDPNRIFISGASGGGRCASMLSVLYPDVFTGGAFYFIGCDFWDNLRVSNKSYLPGFWKRKNIALIDSAKDHKFVFLTGSKDFNKQGTKQVYNAYKKAGFRNCLYIEVSGMGHTLPQSRHVQKGLIFLKR